MSVGTHGLFLFRLLVKMQLQKCRLLCFLGTRCPLLDEFIGQFQDLSIDVFQSCFTEISADLLEGLGTVLSKMLR